MSSIGRKIGVKIYNFGVRKRNEFVAERNFKRDVHRRVEVEAKEEAHQPNVTKAIQFH